MNTASATTADKKPAKAKSATADQPAPDSAHHSFLIPLTLAGVHQRLSVYADLQPHQHTATGFHTVAARRQAWCDLKEAKANLALGQPSAELQEVAAQRKLGSIFDALAGASTELASAAAMAGPYLDRINTWQAAADELKARLADLQARDVSKEFETFETRGNEYRWLNDLFDNGAWRRTNLDNREAAMIQELTDMQNKGRYSGEEISKEAAERRILELEASIAATAERFKTDLTAEEYPELNELPARIQKLEDLIQDERRFGNAVIESFWFQGRRFEDQLAAARIAAENALYIYQLTCPGVSI
jgi:hypothetical protein